MICRRAKCYGEAYNGEDEADQDQASRLMARVDKHVLRQWLSPVVPGSVECDYMLVHLLAHISVA